MNKPIRILSTFLMLALAGQMNAEANTHQDNLEGDLGIGYSFEQSCVKGAPNLSSPMPYAYIDYGRLFCRVDTFGVKTIPLFEGHLEAIGRYSQLGFKTNNTTLHGLAERKDPGLLGLGSFQTTHYGAIALYGFHDFNRSKGTLLEASYALEIPLRFLTVYPIIGCTFQDRSFNRYYYGVSTQEAVQSRFGAYSPESSLNPFVSINLDIPLCQRFHLLLSAQENFLGPGIRNSPLVESSSKFSSLISVTCHFGK